MENQLLQKCGWTAAATVLLVFAFLLFGYSDSYPLLSIAEVLLGALGLGSIVAIWVIDEDQLVYVEWGIIAVSILGFAIWCWIQIRLAPSYATDEVSFDQYSASLLLHGHNPYTSSLAPAFDLFHVQPNGYTFRLNGTPVTQLSYPSMSFLVYLPFLLLGISSQAGIIVNCIAWSLGLLVGWRLLARELRWVIVVLGFVGLYIGFAVGGVTDALYVPLLMLAVYKWDSFERLQGWRAWVGPTAMGLALGIKQTPWLVLGFLLVAMALEAFNAGESFPDLLGQAWRYFWRALVVFFVPNLPFIVWDFGSWIRGVLTPLTGGIVPAGQGWIGISNFLGIGGGDLRFYTLLGFGMLLLSAGLLVVTYPKGKPVVLLLPSIVLFFLSRSFASYLVMLLLPLLVAATSVRPSGKMGALANWNMAKWFVLPPIFIVVLSFAATLFYGQPLALTITGLQTTGQLASIVRIDVHVTNQTNGSLKPLFSSENGGAITAPWNIISGPSTLGAGQTANYQLAAPNYFAQPQLTNAFQMVALTPTAMSVSPPFTPTNLHTEIVPEAVNAPITVGVPVTVKVEVVNATNQAVQRAGIPIFLGQIIYAQSGIQYSQAVINGSNAGQTPVEAKTDANGVATFTIVGTQPDIDPVYFEANLITTGLGYPYGYSTILPIQFVK